MSKDLIRVSLMIREDQHEMLRKMDINVSGYIRDLIDDRCSNHAIIMSVNAETKQLYDQVISGANAGDSDFEPYVKVALKQMLADKIEKLKKIQQSL